MNRSGRIAVYDQPNGPFTLREFPLRAPRRGEVLVRVRMTTICRSDLHSYQGHRPNPCPGVLGHEIIGDIVAIGSEAPRDLRSAPLRLGERITWSEYFTPECGFHATVLDLPQKSAGLEKYGHMAVAADPHHHGGFAEFCYLLPGTAIVKLPAELSDEEATPINCGVATMIAANEEAGIAMGDAVVVIGLGLLGLYGAAIAKARGARRVIGLDPVASRRARAARFGVDVALDPTALTSEQIGREIAAMCPPDGADAVIEVCGEPAVVPTALAWLRTGGTCVLAGLVNPGAQVSIDANRILRRLLTLRGVHNYHPRHLLQAVDFVAAQRERFPFHSLIDGQYGLDQVGQAVADAIAQRVLRAAIVPTRAETA